MCQSPDLNGQPSACVAWLCVRPVLYFKFCRFRASAYTTSNRLLAVFVSMIFAVLLKLENTSSIENLGVSINILQNVCLRYDTMD